MNTVYFRRFITRKINANLTVEKEKRNAEFLTDQAANPLTSRQISCTICKNMTKGYEEKSR